jgi:hypothetical protein
MESSYGWRDLEITSTRVEMKARERSWRSLLAFYNGRLGLRIRSQVGYRIAW